MKIKVIQYYTSNVAYGKYSEEINKKYCSLHGYDYYCEKDDGKIQYYLEGRAATWYKPVFINSHLYDADYILFLDADAIFDDWSKKIEDFIDERYDIVVTEDHGPSVMNAGVLLFKNCQNNYKFLKTWWDIAETLDSLKNGLWHDQTCFGYLANHSNRFKNRIKIIENRYLNHREYGKGALVFHAFAYGMHEYRTIDEVYKDKIENSNFTLEKKEVIKKIYIVYHCFLVKNWKNLVKEQLKRIFDSGLYEATEKIYCTVVDMNNNKDEFLEVIQDYSKIEPYFFTNNQYEHEGIKKVWETADTYDGYVLYLHTKGVSNDYFDPNDLKKDELKIKTVRDWRLLLEYYCIDKWKEAIDKLQRYEMVGVTNNNNWWWGNFWWGTTDYLKKLNPPNDGDRWYYESWVNSRGTATKYEFHHCDFIFYYTDYPEKFYKNKEFYKNSKIILRSALYGTPHARMDEGWPPVEEEPILVDVYNKIEQNLKANDYKRFHFMTDNTLADEDPCWGKRKVLYIKYSYDVEPDIVYNLFSIEGQFISFGHG